MHASDRQAGLSEAAFLEEGDRDKLRPSPVNVASVEAQLRLSDRLAAIGKIAGALASDMNNPLGLTIANLGFAIEELASLARDLSSLQDLERIEGESIAIPASRVARASATVHAVVDALQEARQGADRVRHLVRELRAASRIDDPPVGRLDVVRVLETSMNLVHRLVGPRVQLVRDLGATPSVDGVEGRLLHVFLNLLFNAVEAIPEGAVDRTVRIATRADARGHCLVEISDSGRWIPVTHLQRIFDAFFTTRPATEAGLGLHVAHQLVVEMGGSLTVESREGEGATFRLALPPSGAPAKEETPAPTPVEPHPDLPSRGRILVIDDEPMMVRAIARLLEGEHDVHSMTDPAEAVSQVRAGARFDVILCDLIMPTLSGMDVFDAVSQVSPDQARRFVFMTGGAYSPRVQKFLESVDNPRIEKPLERATLRAAIRAQLSS